MIAIVIVSVIVILAVAYLATAGSKQSDAEALTEREAADRLRPYSGAVESAPRRAPIDLGEE